MRKDALLRANIHTGGEGGGKQAQPGQNKKKELQDKILDTAHRQGKSMQNLVEATFAFMEGDKKEKEGDRGGKSPQSSC